MTDSTKNTALPTPPHPYILKMIRDQLTLLSTADPKMNGVSVDFCGGAYDHRRKYGGGKTQAVVRAMGYKKRVEAPSIVDATAGFGRDAFVFASLGCRVHMIERSPTIAALLADGLRRAYADETIGEWARELISFTEGDSLLSLQCLPFVPDVIYLDPMYPDRKKASNAKKEMQLIKMIVGDDPDADELLPMALSLAQNRVVVKRPINAAPLNDKKADGVIKTTKHRFDLYFLNV